MNAPVLAAATAALSVALLTPGRPGPRRLRKPTPHAPPTGPWAHVCSAFRQLSSRWKPYPIPSRTRRLHRVAAALSATACLLLFPLPWSLAPAVLLYLAAPALLSRLEPSATRRRHARISADLPLAVDLLAACLRAGRPPQAAIATVGHALDGPLATLLAEVERRLDLGADPIDAWSVLRAEPACAAFARATQRALRSGAPLAKTLESQSTDLRQSRRWDAEEQTRAVETRSVLPLGLCFLPAFVLLGVVPTIAATFTGIFTELAP